MLPLAFIIQERVMTDQTPQTNVLQPLSLVHSSLAAMVQKGWQDYWEHQMQLLDGMETIANGWFKRRHAGVRAALQACERMSQATTPTEWIHGYQAWADGAYERVMADATVCQNECSKIAHTIAPFLASATQGE